jgi:hypothetical protein
MNFKGKILQLKKQRMLGKVIIFLGISATMSYASNTRVNVTTMGVPSETTDITNINTVYKNISTTELEKEVERLTINGTVPFEMGIELMKRWTKKV